MVALTLAGGGALARAKPGPAPFHAKAIGVGNYHSCAVTPAGGVRCWGDNDFGALGRGNFTHTGSLTPVRVVGLGKGVSALAAGLWTTCALMRTGSVKCWGSAGGNGRRGDTDRPETVLGAGSGARAIAVGGGSCALTRHGVVKCWGLGESRPAPRGVPGLGSGVQAIAVGDSHACAVVRGGGVKCWGRNRDGQLGNGTTKDSSRAVAVLGLRHGAVAVAAGSYHSCALLRRGGIRCWGSNEYGKLGNGTTKPSSRPVAVLGLRRGVGGIAAGDDHTCALIVPGAVKCWGQSSENGTKRNSSRPIHVPRLGAGVRAIAAGGPHSCALLDGGGVRCWGYNGSGELGNGTTLSSATPVVVRARPLRIAAPRLVVGRRSVTLPGVVTDVSADGASVALRQARSTGQRTCEQVLVWKPSRRSVARLNEKCTTGRSTHYLDLTLAGGRLLWADYSYGLSAYCTGPFTATVTKPKPKLLGLCNGTEADMFLSTAGDGSLAAVSEYEFCDEGECHYYDDQGEIHFLPDGDYHVAIYRFSGGKLVPVLPPVDYRELLGVDGGRLVVEEPEPRRVVLYDANGTPISSVAVDGTAAIQVSLAGDRLVIKGGETLGIYDAATGSLVRSQPIAARARLRDAESGIAVYSLAERIHLLRLSDGRDVVFRHVPRLVGAELEAGGLFYAYNRKVRGHVGFVPFSQLSRRLEG